MEQLPADAAGPRWRDLDRVNSFISTSIASGAHSMGPWSPCVRAWGWSPKGLWPRRASPRAVILPGDSQSSCPCFSLRREAGTRTPEGPTIQFPCLELNPCVPDPPLKLEEGTMSLSLLHQIDLVSP
uniref:Uncharacterized protein n=1 Tax=Molossus molossus TaxID=27622 RepID=A0A7J8BMA3_MOLMO|nr:hypothetical protein HJG59_010121 [Molossus molossus]